MSICRYKSENVRLHGNGYGNVCVRAPSIILFFNCMMSLAVLDLF